jgi:hypothetical protein
MREARPTLSERLREIFSATTEEARRKDLHLKIPIPSGGRPLDPGIRPEDFCDCVHHSVPEECFDVLPNGYKRILLRHFASVWLSQSLEAASGELANGVPLKEIHSTLREFFGFYEANTPRIFHTWVTATFRTELELLDRKARSGAFRDRPGRPHRLARLPSQCSSMSAALTEVFRTAFHSLPKTNRRGRKPSPDLVQARLDIEAILRLNPGTAAKDVCDQLTNAQKPSPYGSTWDAGLIYRPTAVNSLISRVRSKFSRT